MDEITEAQRPLYCRSCGLCLPLAPVPDNSRTEQASPSWIERLKKINSPAADRLEIFDRVIDRLDVQVMKLERQPWKFAAQNTRVDL